MLNLILDTNTWIYLANGFNPETKKNEEETHFQTAEWILKKIEDKKCIIFSNYIIKLEWERNKEKANELINRYGRQLNQKSNELKNNRQKPNFIELAKEFKEWETTVLSKMENNRSHIKTVEEILLNSIEIPITNNHKLNAVDLAIDKKPPFHHKDNSVADAIIFLSTVDYFYYDEDFYIDNTILISNNTSDFGESVNNKKLHPELAKMLKDKPIVFKTNLAEALGMGKDIIAKYQEHLDYINKDVIGCIMHCKGTDYFIAEVEFTEHIDIEVDKEGYTFNPKQLLIDFGENYKFTVEDLKAMEKRKFITIDLGECTFCNATHLRCECGEEHATYGEDIKCGCGRHFSLKNNGVELIENEEN